MQPFVRVLRPHQWLKNSFVFAGILFAHQWQNINVLLQATQVAIAFALMSSSVYIINDFCDRHSDAQHPIKKNRPLAAKQISYKNAFTLAALLSIIALSLAFTVSKLSGIILITYGLLNILYSAGLKNLIFCDVIIIALGFLLRVMAGTWGLHIAPSNWLLLCTLTLTLFLGFTKRRTEQKILFSTTHTMPINLQNYSSKILNKLIILTGTSAMLSYIIYTLQPNPKFMMVGYKLTITIPFVIYGIIRYSYLSQRTSQDYYGLDLANDLLRDRQLLMVITLWVMSVLWILK